MLENYNELSAKDVDELTATLDPNGDGKVEYQGLKFKSINSFFINSL